MSSPKDQQTERYNDPSFVRYAESHAQRVAVLSWTDTAGDHELTIDGPTTLGSAPGKACINDPSVSHVHVELEPTDRGVAVRDLASTNGTFIDLIEIGTAKVMGEFRLRLGRVVVHVRQPTETVTTALWPRARYERLLGQSVVMRGLFQQISQIAPTPETVLIRGETGTGKELVAEAIHAHSKRSRGDLVVVDCGSMPAGVLESELFGHVRGAFTGATNTRVGAFEAANGGTIFLDEIGEMPIEVQPILLRALESRTIRRVGETSYRPIDVRVIAATHRDLREMVNRRTFREDLYFRLAVVPVRLPALRERLEDLPMLVESFLDAKDGFAGRAESPAPRHVIEALMAMPWTGNVRELRNFVARAKVHGWAQALKDEAANFAAVAASSEPPSQLLAEPAAPSLDDDPELKATGGTYAEAKARWIARGEREYLPWLLARHGGHIMEAAIEAGLHNTWLRKRVKALKLK